MPEPVPATLPSQVAPDIIVSNGPSFDTEKWKRICTAADAHSERERSAYDKFVNLYRDGSFPLTGSNETGSGVSANQTYAYIQMLMALLYANQPQIEAEPREDAAGGEQYFMPLVMAGIIPSPDEAKRLFADTLEQVLTYSYSETQSHEHNQAVLFNALVRGLGISKESFDAKRGIDRCDCIDRSEVFFDPNARYSLTQANYVVQTCTLPIEQAREFFAQQGVMGKIEPNFTLSDQSGVAGDLAKKIAPSQKQDDLYKFYEIWHKDGDKRSLYYREWKKDKWLLQREWPFQLDADDFPYSLLSFSRQYATLSDAFPDLVTVEALRKAYEDGVEYINRHAKRSKAKKVVYDKAVFDDVLLRQMEDPVDMRMVAVDVPAGKKLGDLMQVVDFNSHTDADFENADFMKKTRDEILGVDELLRGAETKRMSATESSIRDEYAKLRVGRRQTTLDEWLINQTRHRAQIARQLVSPEKVAQIAGPVAAQVWQAYAGNSEDLIGEYSIGIQAGSTGERAKQKKVEELRARLMDAMQINQAMAPVTMGQPVVDVVAILKDIYKAGGDRRPDRYFIPVQPPPPPPPMPPQGQPAQPGIPSQTQQAPEGGLALPEQLAGALTRLDRPHDSALSGGSLTS